MQGEKFREIGFWGSVGAAGLAVINIIVCFINGSKIYDTELQGDFWKLFYYPLDECYGTVLYKISIVVLVLSLVMLFISFILNTDGVLKIVMIICRVIQLICTIVLLLSGYVYYFYAIQYPVFMCFVIVELIVIIIYIIDRDYRKTAIGVTILAILTLGSWAVCVSLLFCGIAFIGFKIIRFYCGDSSSSSSSYSSDEKTRINNKSDKKIANTGIKKKFNFSNDRAIYKGKGDGRLGYGANQEFICYNNSGTGVKEFICHIKEYEEGKVQIINNGKRITDIPGCKRPKR